MEKLKGDLNKHRDLFDDLYKANNRYKVRQALQNASNEGLNTVLDILHEIAMGKININTKNYKMLVKSKRLPHLNKLKTNLNKLKSGNREQKLKYLRNMSTFPNLFHSLFNLDQ
jgi:aryl-phospho-beta-D-glucosidase BglC (GH1 family)